MATVSADCILKAVFERRKRKNPSYSLRALASSLNISPSSLSLIYAGHRKAGDRIIKAMLASQLLLDREKQALLQVSNLKFSDPCRQSDFETLESDRFDFVADPDHITILSYLRLKNVQRNEEGLIENLPIAEAKILECLSRLERVGLIHRTVRNELRVRLNAAIQSLERKRHSRC